MPCGESRGYQGPIPGSVWPCSPAAAITDYCASLSKSASLTGGFHNVSDRVGTGWCRGDLPVGTYLSARVFITIEAPEKKSVQKPVIVPTYNMAPPEAHAKSATIAHISEEASDPSSQSGDASDSESSHNSSESDSLDSNASRKRRKTSPTEDNAPPIHVTAAPSRIKLRAQSNVIPEKANNGAVLAPVDPQATFASLRVKPWLVQSLNSMAIKRPTGIQKGCIPEILKGRDCIGGSRTGSGKTVAFAVPILQKWAEDPFGIFALVLTPTRYVCVT
jgi:DEAD/DEAH box helicase